MSTLPLDTQDRLIKAALIEAGILTLSRWSLCGAELWFAGTWAMA